jgi:hypothetical protein
MVGAIYCRFGETLRRFAGAGWYRYSGHLGNLVVDDHGNVVLVDVDSSRPMDPATPDRSALEAVRDGMSALYNLACSFFRPGVLRDVADDELLLHEPLARSWFDASYQ